ncbi:MAG: carbohydrate kinase [Salibaculum sp.]|jgi:fructokinase|uniref:carbohydrate kinase family protein n=1 Tax=Salibaculum sp. TaxID=2855480 RepID=UPI00287078FF|nr:carbohydrate kinase [Salibaculum sp.]MDR9426492.1 carbohydrate kinase [Salibaculum sp.]MDR9481153.1 carbohydrate kinase [Salibaculum sp.]
MILCCGEALIDMLPRQSAQGEEAFAPHAGGAVFNTALALGRLGAAPQFLCGMSSDFLGDILRERLAESGVDARPSPRLAAPCTLAFVRLIDGQASYAFYDENSALRSLRAEDIPEVTANALFFGGISLVGDGCGQVYEDLMLAQAETRVTMIDPNIRPGFITDETAYRARIERMLAAADIVKLSDEDLTWLRGAGDLATQARALLSTRTRLVCITEGARGVTGHTEAGSVLVPAPKAQVVDTVGAGDTFNAGLLAGLDAAGSLTKPALAALDEETLRAALDLGARAAAVTVARAGANPPKRAEL